MTGLIFHDPSGRRARTAGLYGGLALSFVAALFAGFLATLVFAPRLPSLTLQDPNVLRALHVETARHLRGAKDWTRIPKPLITTGASPTKPLSVGFYVSWDERARESLAKHVDQLDVVAPQWIALEGSLGAISETTDPQARAVIASAKRPPTILPLVHNARDDKWDGPLADRLLANPAARRALIAKLTSLAEHRGYGGYILDLENLSPAGIAAYPGFVAQVRAALKPSGREVWVTTPFADPSWPMARLQSASDALVLMAYDQHWATGDPGPPAAQGWYQAAIRQQLSHLDPAKIVVALGAYGYDWTKGGTADALTFHEGAQIARDSGVDVAIDENSLNPTFAYQDDAGRDHTVWFLDAVTLFNQIKVTDPWRPRGYALWRLGSEDPGVWSLLHRPFGSASPRGLTALAPGEDVDFDGTGEVLKVSATPTAGRRTIGLDPGSGLITSEHYEVMPTSYVIERYGAHPGLVALTFDDGPDPKWTAKILDVLKAKAAPATFFIIGKNAEERPDLVQREVAEGHMVGNHTYTHPNIAAVPTTEANIELNATQRLFETITGRSMRLFRPPYFGDAEPSTPSEVTPLLAVQKLGYISVGLRIDPDDWKRPDARLIVQRALSRLADHNPDTGGQIVLLHDSGGDRSRTVQALPVLIDALRAHGYRLVTVAELAGMSPAQALPLTHRQGMELALDRLGFSFVRDVDLTLRYLFYAAIVLGVLRLLFLGVFAIVHAVRAPGRTPPRLDPLTGPGVTVLIPCFNEEKVIVSSIRRILESDWGALDIIVLDDGSVDDTSGQVRRHFAGEPRVRLMQFENGGKARALNRGLLEARGDVIVALDADTLFPPETIGLLARWFADPKVGAVAGNALVGNSVNLITRWQALEYVTAQNLERRALAALGAISVVPGAVGAWRKDALLALGGYPADTLAEDQDLTIAVQRAGWRVEFDAEARAYTEAPDTVRGLLTQRFRWSFGTLQCLWKHRSALWDRRTPALGFLALPQIWLFQILLAAVAPLVDLAILWSLVAAGLDRLFHPLEWSSDNLIQALLYWLVFVMVDLSAAGVGLALEKRAPWKSLPWLPVQRFGYRQIMYYVVVKAIMAALTGPRVGWGKLERRATSVLAGDDAVRSPAAGASSPRSADQT